MVGGSGKVSKLARAVLGNRSGSQENSDTNTISSTTPSQPLANNDSSIKDITSPKTTTKSNNNKSSSSASESGVSVRPTGLARRDSKRFHHRQQQQKIHNKSKQAGAASSSSSDNHNNNMEQQRKMNLTEKRPSITAEELTPIVLNQLQTTSKLKEENRRLRRGSRSNSNSSTPAISDHHMLQRQGSSGRQSTIAHGSGGGGSSIGSNSNHVNDSGSESCGEEARIRTAEAFMSGIQSAIQHNEAGGLGSGICGVTEAGLSEELVGEVDSVLSKLMQSINRNDPSLVPLIVTLQSSLKATLKPMDSNRRVEEKHQLQQQLQQQPVAARQEVALSEFSTGNEDPFYSMDASDDLNSTSKIPWKIRAARKRAMKGHTTGMTKEEFAKIKQSLMQSSANFQRAASKSYALSRNKSESAIKYYSTHGSHPQDEIDDSEEGGGGGNQTEPVVLPKTPDLDGYASDVCDYNMVGNAKSKSSPISGRGVLVQPAQLSNSIKQGQSILMDQSYIQQKRPISLVSPQLKPVSPSIESSLYDRRQRLIQKRAKIFQSSESLLCHESPKPWNNSTLYNRSSTTPNNNNNNNNNHSNTTTTTSANNSVLNLTEHNHSKMSKKHSLSLQSCFSNPSPVQHITVNHQATECLSYNNNCKKSPIFSKHNALLQAGTTASNGYSTTEQLSQLQQLPSQQAALLLNPDFNRDFDRKISNDSTTADEENPGMKMLRKKTANTGVRARIARRKKMKDANALDVAHGSLSDQEGGTSEAYDEDDSVEEKQDNEPMDDWQSSKVKSPLQINNSSKPSPPIPATAPDMTPETARKNWNMRFSNIKSSFNAASEEDLSKSRSPSIHRQSSDLDDSTTSSRGRSKVKEASKSPMFSRPSNFSTSGSASPAMIQRIERPQSKEDKDKENSIRASSLSNIQANIPKKLSAPNATTSSGELSKSKQPTPSRENNLVVATRASKSMPRDSRQFNDSSRAEVVGLVQASRHQDDTVNASSTKSGGGDMDYQEYMNIIHRVRKTKEHSRVRAEHYKLASMYAKEKKRQEELTEEEERLKIERQKIEADKKDRPQPIPIMPVYPTVHQKPVNHPSSSHQATVAHVMPSQARIIATSAVTPIISTMSTQEPMITSTSGVRHQQQHHHLPDESCNSLHGSQQSLEDEKGQMDKVQSEMSKLDTKFKDDNTNPNIILRRDSQQTIDSFEEEDVVVVNKCSIEPIHHHASAVDSVEQERLKQIEIEHKRQQEIRENLVKAEQEKLQKLREDQMRQEKDREEIRRLEFERLKQIQEEQKQLEEERRRQEETIKVEQLRIEEERRRQEKLQAEKNAEYNRQRLEMEAKNVALNDGQRVVFDPRGSMMSPQEKVLQERLMEQERLRQDHRKEESNIRQEKLKLIQQEEFLIARQEDMLHQIEAERENLFKQEQLIRKRQQERLDQVRQEKQLLEKQEEMIKIREQQLEQERKRQEKLREEQIALKEQEEAIKKRQEQISKELLSAKMMQARGDHLVMSLEDQMFLSSNPGQTTDASTIMSSIQNLSSDINNSLENNNSAQNIIKDNNQEEIMIVEENEEDEEGNWSGSGSGSETISEENEYECKVEVKQSSNNFAQHPVANKPSAAATKPIESHNNNMDDTPWAPVTPYLTFSEKQTVQAQEEISAIFSQSKSFTRPGVITSPESMRTSTNLITTPESSLQSQISFEPRSFSSSCTNSPLPHVPQLPMDDPVTPKVPTRMDSLNFSPGATDTARSSLEVPQILEGANGPRSPRIGGPGSAFKPYASNENLFDSSNFPAMKSATESSIGSNYQPKQNYPLSNGNGTDSRYFMRGGKGPMHGKVRELRRQPLKQPFSTTDTEPEMKECNLSAMDSRRKGKQNKAPVYSTSETEEEYQAYLRCKPKWHGRGGHKNSWDPLLIQSPPQITQKPVGVLQKPKAQPAGTSTSNQTAAPAVERGSQLGSTPIFVPPQAQHVAPPKQPITMMPLFMNTDPIPALNFSKPPIPHPPPNSQSNKKLAESNNNLEVRPPPPVFQLLEEENPMVFTNGGTIHSSQVPTTIVDSFPNQNAPVSITEIPTHVPTTIIDYGKGMLDEQRSNKVIHDNTNADHSTHLTTCTTASEDTRSGYNHYIMVSQAQAVMSTTSQSQSSNNTSFLNKPPSMDSTDVSHSFLNKPSMMDHSNTSADVSHSFLKPMDSNTSADVSPMPPQSPLNNSTAMERSQLSKERSPLMNQQPIINSNENTNSNNSLRPAAMEMTTVNNSSTTHDDNTKSNNFVVEEEINDTKVYDDSQVIDDDQKVPKRTTAQQRLQQKLMSEALQKVELKKEEKRAAKQPSSNVSSRHNPTIAAMEIMTRKEIKAGEMEERLARGEVPDIPIPPTPEHFKTDPESSSRPRPQQNFLQNIASQSKATGPIGPMTILKRSDSMNNPNTMASPKPTMQKRFSQENIGADVPIIMQKKLPKRLGPDEIKVRQAQAQERRTVSPSPATMEVTTTTAKKDSIGTSSAAHPPKGGQQQQSNNNDNSRFSKQVPPPVMPESKLPLQGNNISFSKNIPSSSTVAIPQEVQKHSHVEDRKPVSLSSSETKKIDQQPNAKQVSINKADGDTKAENSNNPGIGSSTSLRSKKVSPEVEASAKHAAIASTVPKTITPAPPPSKQGLSKAEIAFQQVKIEKLRAAEQASKIKKQQPAQVTAAENVDTVRKAAELYEKSTTEIPTNKRFQPGRKVMEQSRSKSIGSNLAVRMQMAASSFADVEDDPVSKPILPWANDEAVITKHANPGIRKHLAAREANKGNYKLRMSKSSDSITAAKLLAESRQKEGNIGGGLRINQNQNMSKSIERQLDVYTKTREDIRKILDAAKACSVQDRIKLFNCQAPLAEQPVESMTREEKAEAIRREILEAKATGGGGHNISGGANNNNSDSSDNASPGVDIQIQSPIEAKVKPLKIPLKPKLVETEVNRDNNNVRPEPGTKLRINQSATANNNINTLSSPPQQPSLSKSPEIKSILRTSSKSIERSGGKKISTSSEQSSIIIEPPTPTSPVITKPKSILVKKTSIDDHSAASSISESTSRSLSTTAKKSPKLLHSNSLRGATIAGNKDSTSTRDNSKNVVMPRIYAQSATDVSATEDENSERLSAGSGSSKMMLRKKSAPAASSSAIISPPPSSVVHHSKNNNTSSQFLQVPIHSEVSGLRKSKSFASPGQYECAMSEGEVNTKQKTIMAFFDASLTNNPNQILPGQQQHPTTINNHNNNNNLQNIPRTVATIPASVMASSVIKRSSAAQHAAGIHQKRGSITSISDEILGDDDLKDVDAVFESLLNSTFQEIQARGRQGGGRGDSRENNRGGAKKRSASSHPTVARLQETVLASTASNAASESSIGSGPMGTTTAVETSAGSKTSSTITNTTLNKKGAVNRKQSKNKLVAGEVKSVIPSVVAETSQQGQPPSENQSQQNNNNNSMMNKKEVLNDPIAALPTSHNKKYLPRQQTWASPSPPPPNLLPPPSSGMMMTPAGGGGSNTTVGALGTLGTQTPSPTQKFGRRNVNFAKFQQMDDTTAENHSRLTRQASLPSLNDKKSGAGTPPVSAHSPNSNTNNGLQRSFGGGGGSSGRSSVVARSPSSAKEVILTWIQERTKNYSNINVTNFSSSWSDGLAFCALIHYYYPEAFDYDKLEAKNRRYNFELAFKTAEDYADICPLLDVEDMVLMLKPDWKCVFTYVQSFYRRFRHGREPPIPTKTLTLTPHTAPHSSTTIKSIEVREVKETLSEHHKKTTYYFPAPEINDDKKQNLMQKYLFEDATLEKPLASTCSSLSPSTSSSSTTSSNTTSKVKVKKTKAVAFASAPAPTDDAPPLPNNNNIVKFTNALPPSSAALAFDPSSSLSVLVPSSPNSAQPKASIAFAPAPTDIVLPPKVAKSKASIPIAPASAPAPAPAPVLAPAPPSSIQPRASVSAASDNPPRKSSFDYQSDMMARKLILVKSKNSVWSEPEITEEKKKSLMQKYLFDDDDNQDRTPRTFSRSSNSINKKKSLTHNHLEAGAAKAVAVTGKNLNLKKEAGKNLNLKIVNKQPETVAVVKLPIEDFSGDEENDASSLTTSSNNSSLSTIQKVNKQLPNTDTEVTTSGQNVNKQLPSDAEVTSSTITHQKIIITEDDKNLIIKKQLEPELITTEESKKLALLQRNLIEEALENSKKVKQCVVVNQQQKAQFRAKTPVSVGSAHPNSAHSNSAHPNSAHPNSAHPSSAHPSAPPPIAPTSTVKAKKSITPPADLYSNATEKMKNRSKKSLSPVKNLPHILTKAKSFDNVFVMEKSSSNKEKTGKVKKRTSSLGQLSERCSIA